MGAILIQQASAFANASTIVLDSADGWLAPSAGSLLIAWANADATVTVNNSMTAGPSVVDGNGVYFWHKVAAGTESSYTFTHAVSAKGTAGVLEYTGLAPSTPFDVSNTSTIAGSAGVVTTSCSVTTTGADGSLVVALAGLHASGGSTNVAQDPSWTNGFTQLQSVASGNPAVSDSCVSFFSAIEVGSTGSIGTVCSWTNNMSDRQALVMAFDIATVIAGDDVGSPVFVGPSRK